MQTTTKNRHIAWPTTAEQHRHMRQRQAQNIAKSKNNAAENWMSEKLKKAGLKFKRQAQWGIRLYDFWDHKTGIAIEVDGTDHNKARDSVKDKLDFNVSAIVVLRVRNFNEADAEKVITQILRSESWNDRRLGFGLKEIKTGGRLG